jgi:phosphoglucomutase
LAGSPVSQIKDFKEQTNFVVAENATKTMIDIPKSNVLIYYTEDGTKVCVRPSGTEPKIKFYVSVKDALASKDEFEHKIKSLEEKIQQIKADLHLN